MSDVQGVKTAVGKHHAPAVALMLRDLLSQYCSRNNFGNSFAHKLRGGSGCLAADGIEKFRARNRGCATFHHDEASGNVGNVRGFKRSEEHTSELQSQSNLVCRLLLE